MKKVTILLIGLGLLLVFSQELAAKRPTGGGDGAISGHISMYVDGDVVADQDCDANLGADTTIYTCNKAGDSDRPHKILLGEFFKSHNYPGGVDAAKCFPPGPLNVTMQVMLNKDSSAETVLRFWGFKGDGETKILYVLRVNDRNGWRDVNGSPGNFPPLPKQGVIMGEFSGISWNLATSKRNLTNTCVDSGIFPAGVSNGQFINVIFARDS